VVVVDDSIVRGTTTRKIVAMLFEEGALEVHLRISSPPIVSPCFYGIDMADEDELIAGGRSVEEVREQLGATSLAYLSLDGLQDSTRRPEGTFCRACLTSDYPTRIPDDLKLAKLRFEGQAARAPSGAWRTRRGRTGCAQRHEPQGPVAERLATPPPIAGAHEVADRPDPATRRPWPGRCGRAQSTRGGRLGRPASPAPTPRPHRTATSTQRPTTSVAPPSAIERS
jgi:amidophosphoribosyltransferase